MNPSHCYLQRKPSELTYNPVNSFWRIVANQLANNQCVFIAVVAEHTKHSPGTTGAKLLVAEDIDPVGTIGGGIMEYNLVKRANSILQQENFLSEIQTFIHRKSGPGEKSGMICAGKQTNLYYLCCPEKDIETADKIINRCMQKLQKMTYA